MKFSTFNIDISSPIPDPLGSMRPAHPSKKWLSAIGLSDVKMVPDMYRHAAYHNKQWRRAS